MMRGNRRKGSVLIEFAGSLILLATLCTGIFRIAYAFYAYGNLVGAVRAGARYASLAYRGRPAADPEFARSVRDLVVYGDIRPAPGAKPMVPGLANANVDLTMRPDSATVAVRGFELDALFMKIQLDGRPTVTFPSGRESAQ